ncbi:MAG: SH3 domain-containing protein [Defluviitaleaceae bacterium]|nr:SH3 domain-containing protein [Defluviitaleaceae bacterium]
MTIIRTTFDWAGALYSRWFADWLHVHFIIRTVLLLLLMWLIIFLGAQLFKYVLLPLVLMLYYHVFFRAWNFLFVETPQEWLYLRYHSKDKPDHAQLYSRLCDKVKRNRLILKHTKFAGMMIRARRPASVLMFICLVASTLWISAFGLHQEYAAPALVLIDNTADRDMQDSDVPDLDLPPDESSNNENDLYDYYTPGEAEAEPTPGSHAVYAPGTINPAGWPAESNIRLSLTEQGAQGARLRDGPGIAGNTIIEILWDDTLVTYLHSFVPDVYVNGLYWLRVRTPGGAEGYISSQLVEVAG